MSRELPQFDDPGLKAAISRLRGGHKASEELRRRVAEGMAAAREAEEERGPIKMPIAPEPAPEVRFRLWRPLAIAASVLIVVGGSGGYVYYKHVKEEREEYVRNDALLDAMIEVNEIGSKAPAAGHVALAAPMSDAGALANEASKSLGRKVPAPAFASQQGWKMDAASVCSINAMQSARFHFVKDGHGVTVISMPASAWVGNHEEGKEYDLVADGHPIAGFVRAGSLNCVVGDPSVSRGEVNRLRDELARG